MRKDPFYEQDFFSKQIEQEERLRKEKLKSYANEQKQIYKDYINKRETEMKQRKDIITSNANYTNDNNQRKHYLDSDIFNVRPLPQKEQKTHNQHNQMEEHPKLSKEEYLAFKEYLKQQELNKKEMIEQQHQQITNEQEIQQPVDYVKTPSVQMMNYHNVNKNYHEQQRDLQNNENVSSHIKQPPQTQDHDYLKQYANLLKQQEQEEQQKLQIQQMKTTKQSIDDSRQEYLNNRNKNIGTYANLTHLMTINPSLKTIPQHYNYIDPDKENDIQSKITKQKLYKQYLDEQNLENRNNNYINRTPNYNPCKYYIIVNCI